MQDMTNIVALKGLLGETITKESKLCNMDYEYYRATIQTTRRSGVVDTANIVIPVELAAAVEKIEAEANTRQNPPIMCTGKLQTLKDWETGSVLLFVLADFVGVLTGDNYEEENAVHIELATLGKQPTYRETPRGKHIADTTIKVNNILRPHNPCYIPAIFWEKDAEALKTHTEGDAIAITGRLQSREYSKVIDENTQELHTAYELSISSIDSIQESEE